MAQMKPVTVRYIPRAVGRHVCRRDRTRRKIHVRVGYDAKHRETLPSMETLDKPRIPTCPTPDEHGQERGILFCFVFLSQHITAYLGTREHARLRHSCQQSSTHLAQTTVLCRFREQPFAFFVGIDSVRDDTRYALRHDCSTVIVECCELSRAPCHPSLMPSPDWFKTSEPGVDLGTTNGKYRFVMRYARGIRGREEPGAGWRWWRLS